MNSASQGFISKKFVTVEDYLSCFRFTYCYKQNNLFQLFHTLCQHIIPQYQITKKLRNFLLHIFFCMVISKAAGRISIRSFIIFFQGPLLITWIIWIIGQWISNCIHYKMWHEITYPFLKFIHSQNSMWNHWSLECTSNFIPHFTKCVIYPCDLSMLELKLNPVGKRGPQM